MTRRPRGVHGGQTGQAEGGREGGVKAFERNKTVGYGGKFQKRRNSGLYPNSIRRFGCVFMLVGNAKSRGGRTRLTLALILTPLYAKLTKE